MQHAVLFGFDVVIGCVLSLHAIFCHCPGINSIPECTCKELARQILDPAEIFVVHCLYA